MTGEELCGQNEYLGFKTAEDIMAFQIMQAQQQTKLLYSGLSMGMNAILRPEERVQFQHPLFDTIVINKGCFDILLNELNQLTQENESLKEQIKELQNKEEE